MNQETEETPPPNDRFNLSWNFYVLWIILTGVIVMKSLLIREMGGSEWLVLFGYLLFMLGASLAASWAAWRITRKQKPTELIYLAVMAVLFLVETVRLYRDGFAD